MSTIAETAHVGPLVVTIGDPAGVGPELIATCWRERTVRRLPDFAAIGPAWLAELAPDLPIIEVDAHERYAPGAPGDAGARVAVAALEQAATMLYAGVAGAVVTAPVGKAALYDIGFRFPGQTEFFAARAGVAEADCVMMLAGPSLRVAPLTIHIPLGDVARSLTADLIQRRIRVTAAALRRDFSISRPRLAVAGLNPHAGEAGSLGREEVELISPALVALRAEGLDIAGPLSADTLFHAHVRARYDVAICMYHDQALIPIKTLDFDEGVNVTLGLPFVRTSPDHGTAYDIAGMGVARPDAMAAAIRMAGDCLRARARFDARG